MKTIRTKAHRKLIEFLVEARSKQGLTQAEVAKRLGYSQTWIARIEVADRRIDAIELVRIAKLYRLDPHTLIDIVRKHDG